MNRHPLCFATNNPHKLAEARAILQPWFELVSLDDIGCRDELPETTGTIAGNSRQKAAYIHQRFGVNCFADDSGLEVTALGGAPGVDSAMYAGPQRNHGDNINLLLKNLKNVDQPQARFITVITFVEGRLGFQFVGSLPGTIVQDRRGSEGFGYDPVFVPDGFARTLAEMSMAEKNEISHRSRALQKLVHFAASRDEAFVDATFNI